jgi:hypothetical protein
MDPARQKTVGQQHDQKGKAALDEWKQSGKTENLGKMIEGAGKKPMEEHGADTAYTGMLNQVLAPTPGKRVSAEQALESDFFKDALLSDEDAQGVLKQMLAGREAAKTGAEKPSPLPKSMTGKTATKAPKTSTAIEQMQKEGMKAGGVTGYFNTKSAVSQQKKAQQNMLKEMTKKKPPLKTPPKNLIKDRSAPNLAMATEQMVKKTKEEVKQEDTE